MTRHCGPRADTVAFQVLAALDAAPAGSMTTARLLLLLDENNRTKYKLVLRTDVLLVWDLVRRLPDGLQILPAGRIYLETHAPRAAAPDTTAHVSVKPTSIATPRTAPAFKPLDMAKLMRGRPMREGMDDLRDAPSLMGATRVAGRTRSA